MMNLLIDVNVAVAVDIYTQRSSRFTERHCRGNGRDQQRSILVVH